MKRHAILIVDDVELNRAILCELFRKDYEILEAEDGEEALRLIRERQDDLSIVLLDIVMPVLDGFGVLEAMGAEHFIDRIPVIMITAENSETVALHGYELGVSDIINKPFSPSIVHRRVTNVIALYRYRFRMERIVHRQKAVLDRQAQKLDRLGVKRPEKPAIPPEELPDMLPVIPAAETDQVSRRVLWLLELEREKYRILSEMSGDIIFNYDAQSDTMEFTENYRTVFGGDTKRRRFSQSLNASNKILPKDRARLEQKLLELSASRPTASERIQLRTSGGELEWFEIYVSALWEREAGQCVGYMGKITNINDMKAEADHWREEAYRDPLTALYNRKAVEELSARLFERKPVGEAVLFFVDIDNFKQLNDQLGHLYGDQVLRYVGREMQHRFRSTDIVGRIGGDEFVVLLNNTISLDDIRRKANELCGIFRHAPGQELLEQPISGSVGIALSPGDGDGFLDLLHKADMALYHAKSQGKNQYAFYGGQP